MHGITTNAYVDLLAIVNHPREITGRHAWIEKAMKSRRSRQRNVFEYFLDSDDPFVILIESERAADAGVGSIRAHEVRRAHLT